MLTHLGVIVPSEITGEQDTPLLLSSLDPLPVPLRGTVTIILLRVLMPK